MLRDRPINMEPAPCDQLRYRLAMLLYDYCGWSGIIGAVPKLRLGKRAAEGGTTDCNNINEDTDK